MKFIKRIDFNSPVILSLAAISLVVLIINSLTGGWLNNLFAVYYTSFLDPKLYMRLFTHCVTHQDMAHYTGNFLLILAVGPMVEEKYGSRNILIMICISSVLTGLINVLFFSGTALLGASGIAFMLILLASFVNIREGKIPMTVILVAVLYIGNEIVSGLFSKDQISHLSHIIGGLCGTLFGVILNSKKLNRNNVKAGA